MYKIREQAKEKEEKKRNEENSADVYPSVRYIYPSVLSRWKRRGKKRLSREHTVSAND